MSTASRRFTCLRTPTSRVAWRRAWTTQLAESSLSGNQQGNEETIRDITGSSWHSCLVPGTQRLRSRWKKLAATDQDGFISAGVASRGTQPERSRLFSFADFSKPLGRTLYDGEKYTGGKAWDRRHLAIFPGENPFLPRRKKNASSTSILAGNPSRDGWIFLRSVRAIAGKFREANFSR